MKPYLPPDDDALDTWLRRGADVPLPDDGMSKRVLAALPPPAAPASPWKLWLPIGLGALAGVICVVLIDRNGSGTSTIESTVNQIAALVSDPGTLLTLAICAALGTGSSVVGDLLED